MPEPRFWPCISVTLRANEDETSAHQGFRLEGAEGSSRTCPCPIQQVTRRLAPPGLVEAVGRQWWRRQPPRHQNYLIVRAGAASARRTSYASWPSPIPPLRPAGSAPSCVAGGFIRLPSPTGAG